ncbi:pyridoxal phosphate-dependent aminotransferase [Bradyrhizobium sp. ORS 375]|uniref:pyridoxal phosphate-dependent aminotransferase n=1 Tax=Bradyrhizobium sp. (strain ORS 375) TaxID=566679 RepID=UPI000557D849|nr:pyridoxal phosphate-dependent aminotransferase [Bradyrhizobium sp. ORS 375]
MDIISVPGSQIIQVARAAAARRGVAFLCFGESDVSSPASAQAALKRALDEGDTKYPDVRGIPELREAIASYLTALHAREVPEDRVQVVASGMAAISVALAFTVRAGDRVLVHGPVWPNILNAARLRQAQVTQVALRTDGSGKFMLDMDELSSALPGHRVFILNSPNNPTGWTATREELQEILALCRRHDVWLISDEVYSRLVYSGAHAAPSLLDIISGDDRVVVCNSFSKTWAMTGWRVGWLVLPRGLRDPVANVVEVIHSGVAPFSQRGALAAIADHSFVRGFQRHCAAGRSLTADALSGLERIGYAVPDGSFFAFIRVDGMKNSLEFALTLVEKHGIAVAPGSAFGSTGEGYIRICFGLERARLSHALSRLRTALERVR